jgi:hypothetical protein
MRIPLAAAGWMLAFGTLVAACGVATRHEAASSDLRDLTGAHTRVVWVQHEGDDPFAIGGALTLMGLDTEDGRGERAILDTPGSFVKPMFTDDGRRVVYSTRANADDWSVEIVDFDGTGRRRLADGFALDLWESPVDGIEWIYVGTGHHDDAFGVVERMRVDDPSRRERVPTPGPIGRDTFQVSPDGRLAGALAPWPAAGVLDLADGAWRPLGEGCWTALNDPGAPLFWYFDGAHRNLLLVDVARDRRWIVPINRAPGFADPEVYHPRWTPHPRFIVLSGPYDQGGANQVRSGGGQAEIWAGRFAGDFSTIKAWARVTENTRADAFPDLWVDQSLSPHPRLASGRLGPPSPREPAAADRRVVDARLVEAGTVPTPEAIAPYRHALVVNRYEVVTVVEGDEEPRELLVAQWAIRDRRVLDEAAREVGRVYRLTVERYEAHGELEGERLIRAAGLPEAPLYYDVDSAR